MINCCRWPASIGLSSSAFGFRAIDGILTHRADASDRRVRAGVSASDDALLPAAVVG
jgi:hypothetical protein